MKARVASRFDRWPCAIPPHKLTAAQALLLAEALAERQPIADARGREPKSRLASQPRMPKQFLKELAKRAREERGG